MNGLDITCRTIGQFPMCQTSSLTSDRPGGMAMVGLIAGPLVAGIVWMMLPHHYHSVDGVEVAFSAAGRATLSMMVWMAIWWLTEAIDVAATSLVPLAAFPVLGILPINATAAPYASPFIFLFLGGFILALSMQRWGLDRRIALLTLRLVGTKPQNMIGGFMLATAMLSGFVSNTATAAMMLPIGLSVLDLVSSQKNKSGNVPAENTNRAADTKHRNFGVCLMLGIAYAASIGGLATVIGSPPNVLVVGFIRDEIDVASRRDIGFAQWMIIGLPLAAILLPIVWVLLTRVIFPVDRQTIEGGREFLEKSFKALGPPSKGELITFIVFMMAAVAWIARPFLNSLDFDPGPENLRLLAGLSDAGIAVGAALLLFIVPANLKQREFVMNWKTAQRLPWGVLILFGGGLSLASAIETNGVAEMIGAQAAQLGHISPLVTVLIVVTAVIFFSELASNTATAATFIPILAALAPGLGVHPFLLIIPAGFAASCAFMMPVGTPPNALVFGTGYVTIPQMCKAGFWINVIAILLISGLAFLVVKPFFT